MSTLKLRSRLKFLYLPLFLLFLSACASSSITKSVAMNHLEYGMELAKVRSILGNEGDPYFFFRLEDAKYTGLIFEPDSTGALYCLVFENSALHVLSTCNQVSMKWQISAVNGGDELPYQSGFGSFLERLAQIKQDIGKTDFSESAPPRSTFNEKMKQAGEAAAWSWAFLIASPLIVKEYGKEMRFVTFVNNLLENPTLQYSKNNIIAEFGKPSGIIKNSASNYEVIVYFPVAFGIRNNVLEWVNLEYSGIDLYY